MRKSAPGSSRSTAAAPDGGLPPFSHDPPIRMIASRVSSRVSGVDAFGSSRIASSISFVMSRCDGGVGGAGVDGAGVTAVTAVTGERGGEAVPAAAACAAAAAAAACAVAAAVPIVSCLAFFGSVWCFPPELAYSHMSRNGHALQFGVRFSQNTLPSVIMW